MGSRTTSRGLDTLLRRDGASPDIPWDGFDPSVLDERQRRIVGADWRHRMEQEHLAVGAFSLLASELAADGCDRVVLGLVARAAADEVRHAELCADYARQLLGPEQVPSRLRGTPKVPAHRNATPSERVLLHVVEMCCLNETLTCAYLTEMLARTENDAPRELIRTLLTDEIDHGRVGWAYLGSRAAEGQLEGLLGALPSMLDRTVGDVIDAARASSKDDDPTLEAFAYLGRRASADVYRATLRDAILPGFEEAGVPVASVHEHVRARGWLSL